MSERRTVVTVAQAVEIARDVIASSCELRSCGNPEYSRDAPDEEQEYFFEVIASDSQNRIGFTPYLAISKRDGAVRHIKVGE